MLSAHLADLPPVGLDLQSTVGEFTKHGVAITRRTTGSKHTERRAIPASLLAHQPRVTVRPFGARRG